MEAHATDDPAALLAAVGSFLSSRPVEHNLVLTLLHQRLAKPEPARYAWVADGSEVHGVFFQSPPDFFATITPMRRDAIDTLVACVADLAPDLSGVNGEAATSAGFAGSWATHLRSPATTVEAHRLYSCAVLRPTPPLAGAARHAGDDDFDLVAAWNQAFCDETGAPTPFTDTRAAAEHALATRTVWLWTDEGGDPASLVANSPPVAGVGRIGPVYTPPERRGQGFGTALTAHVTAELLAEGVTVALFTELTNPTSNALYQRLGYIPVCEFVRYRFGGS